MELVMFTKHLKRTAGLSLDEAAVRMADWGFAGADLTVREGGYVAPEDAATALPEAVDLLDAHGLSVPMITTGITDAAGPHAETIFETADACGIGYLKLGYWRYDGFGTLRDGLNAMRDDLDGIDDLSGRYEVTPAVHIHSGDTLSAEAAVLWDLLRDHDPDRVGAYLDPGHMTIEGGLSGWEMGMDLLADHARMVAVKDFEWVRDEGVDGRDWTVRHAPLDEGIVPWPDVFDGLATTGFDGPISLHSEYPGTLDVTVDEFAAQTREDLAYVRGLVDRTDGEQSTG